MAPIVRVKFVNEKLEDDYYENAEVAITPPGIFVIQNDKGPLAYLPIGHVASISYPQGPGLIQTLN